VEMVKKDNNQQDFFINNKSNYQSEKVITAIDIGSDKVVCLIGKVDNILDRKKIRLIGSGYSQSKGIINGGITNINDLEESIRKAVDLAENQANYEVENVSVNVSGNYIRTERVFGELFVGSQIINQNHIAEVIEIAKQKFNKENKKILHVIPSNYIVDNIKNIVNPSGMSASKLGVKLLFIYANPNHINNLENIINSCFLNVNNFTAKPYTSALSALTDEEKNQGSVCIDIGAGTTSISVFLDGSIVYAKSLNLGGWYITNDISKELSTPFDQAEALKTLYGSALRGVYDGEEIFQIPLIDGNDENRISFSRSKLISIIKPRLWEILMHSKKCIEQSGYKDISNKNTIITGGTSELPGSIEFAERILETRVRIGFPSGINNLVEDLSGPAFTSCTGMLLHSVLMQENEIKNKSKNNNFAFKLIEKLMGSGF
jgi:cell division protein FtsA